LEVIARRFLARTTPPSWLLASMLAVLPPMLPGTASALTLQEVMAAMASVRTERAYFEEEKTISVLQEPIRTTGVLAYRAPAYMLKETLTPFLETLEVDGDRLRIDSVDINQRINLPSYPLLQALVEAVRATLAGNLARLQQFYAVTFAVKEATWTLQLEPLQAEVREHLARTTIHGADNRISRVETLEADGDRSVMTVTVIELE
jgi:outer membrane lipoprotein-sorting protein